MALSRSQQMSRIRGKNTQPERLLRGALWAAGLRYRLHVRTPFGRPDIVFPDRRIAVFVDGCYWHGCPLHYARPRTREEFWSAKLVLNVERDAHMSRMLTESGWMVIRVWEHEIVEDLELATERVKQFVRTKAGPSWLTQRRVRNVVEISGRVERREYVLLGEPTVVTEAVEGPRVTSKSRATRRCDATDQEFESHP